MCANSWTIAAVAICSLWLAPQTVSAHTFHCGAGDVACLISSIQLANVNGQDNTIRLEAGTYTLTGVDNTTDGPNGLPSMIGSIVITGAGAEHTDIARASNAPEFRLFHVGPDGNLTVDGVNLTGGGGPFFNVDSGGAIRNNGGVVNIVRSALVENLANDGGALFNRGGIVNISRSTFARNSAVADGGLSTHGGTVRIIESRFSQNGSGHGNGGIGVRGGTVFIANSTFDRNGADGAAAIGVENNAFVVVSDSAFIENSAVLTGPGAVSNIGGTVIVTNTTFARNVLNRSAGGGSAIANLAGTLILTNSTLANNNTGPLPHNPASALLGAADATTLVQNSIIANNDSNGSRDCLGFIKSLGNNLIGNTTGCGIILQPSDLTGDPGLGDFTDNGNPGNGHFRLLPGSQAINAGNDAACPETDQIGRRRSGQCDVGAIEFRHRENQRDENDEESSEVQHPQ